MKKLDQVENSEKKPVILFLSKFMNLSQKDSIGIKANAFLF